VGKHDCMSIPPGWRNLSIETSRVVLGDHLSRSVAALADLDVAHDVVPMAERMDECSHVPHHLKKIVLVLSAMRHFARPPTARRANAVCPAG